MSNRLEVYKFWLGFCEKVVLLLLATIIVPLLVGRISIPVVLVLVWSFVCIFLILLAVALSVRVWKLKNNRGDE